MMGSYFMFDLLIVMIVCHNVLQMYNVSPDKELYCTHVFDLVS